MLCFIILLFVAKTLQVAFTAGNYIVFTNKITEESLSSDYTKITVCADYYAKIMHNILLNVKQEEKKTALKAFLHVSNFYKNSTESEQITLMFSEEFGFVFFEEMLQDNMLKNIVFTHFSAVFEKEIGNLYIDCCKTPKL